MTSRRATYSPFVRYGVLPLAGILLVIGLRLFVLLPIQIQTEAMSPSLRAGSWALFLRSGSVDRGMVILYRQPDSKSLLVGRVIALPGDSLRACDGKLSINGRRVTDHRQGADRRECYSLRLPRSGGVYPITPTSLVAYRSAIVRERLDTGRGRSGAKMSEAQLLDEVARSRFVTLREDYYWVLTDQPQLGPDSRHMGILPKSAIIGRLLLSLPLSR